MWFRKRELFEEDPKSLSLESLSTLQTSLISKLILVNDEIMGRYRRLAELSNGLPNAEANASLFSDGANQLRAFNLVLHSTRLPRKT